MTARYKSTGKVDLRKIGDVVLLPKKGALENMDNRVLILNDVAAFLWQRLVDGLSQDEIVEDVVSKFKVAGTEISKDLAFFTDTLVYLGLLAEGGPVKTRKGKRTVDPKEEPGTVEYRHPKIFVYNLETEEETAFGPHVRGKSGVHRAVTRAYHGGCC